ncbi:MAG: hypothetical protein ACLTTJ_14245 [Blautia sp.]
MGGTIEVESQLGCGTKMTVVLPFELASEKQILEEKQKEKEKISTAFWEKRVLLAEDNELNAEISNDSSERKWSEKQNVLRMENNVWKCWKDAAGGFIMI